MATVFSSIFGGLTKVFYSRQQHEVEKEPTAEQVEDSLMKVDDHPSNDSCSDSDSDSDSDFNPSHIDFEFESYLIDCLEKWDLDEFEEFLNLEPQNHTGIALRNIMQSIDVHDKENFKNCVTEALSMSVTGLPPLYLFAKHGGLRLTALFLELGENPNIRIPTLNKSVYPNAMLPLNAVLSSFAFCWPIEGAAVRFICFLCYASTTQRLETARLLASKTKELDQEICTYLALGRVPELCALMLLGYHPQVSSMMNYCNESSKELMEQLLDIFNRVGDKLVNYAKLQRSKGVDKDRVKMDIALLCNDGNYQVRTKDITSPGDYVCCIHILSGSKSYSVCSLYHSLVLDSMLLSDDFRTWRRMFRDFIKGSCSLNTSSIANTRKIIEHYYLPNNFTLRGLSIPCSPPFLMRILRRAARI